MNTQRKIVIALGSQNPIKIIACERMADHYFQSNAIIESCEAVSKVAVQPMSYRETIAGATNRAKIALKRFRADYGVGVESGIWRPDNQTMLSTTWAVVINPAGEIGLGSGGYYLLPRIVAQRIEAGQELGPIMDDLMGVENSKQRQGTNGILTKGAIERRDSCWTALIYAFYRFANPML